jgi:hypothetical protein
MGDDLKALPDIDAEAYTRLASKFRALHEPLGTGITTRRAQAEHALDGWSGQAAKLWADRFTVGDGDAQEIKGALEWAAQVLDGPEATSMKSAVLRENQRRKAARDWLAKREQWKKDHPKHWYDVTRWFESDNWEERIGPMPSPVPEPEPEQTTPPANPRRTHDPRMAV